MEKMKAGELLSIPVGELLQRFPFFRIYLEDLCLDADPSRTLHENLAAAGEAFFENRHSSPEEEEKRFLCYAEAVARAAERPRVEVDHLTIYPGRFKDGTPETFQPIRLAKGTVTAIVGFTGSGKSRLLEDIEWQAQSDTPTGRKIHLAGPEGADTPSRSQHLAAMISQNMNFVIDMDVWSFLLLHAQCENRAEQGEALSERVYRLALQLCGEPFARDAGITSLSGGQSRALMIADCAVLSHAPVVLIDEIENAGISAGKALSVLTGSQKIVLIATHDPEISLMSRQRLVMRNGGIAAVLEQTNGERELLEGLRKINGRMQVLRSRIRSGAQPGPGDLGELAFLCDRNAGSEV
ncbi:MAG: ATP-binding cassette domain-containing protein [Lachnospiraceae bacterium]